mmetsp:Transcript_59598/g.116932  ORF Transcript_59598/g.116932 Transcript_59598/m.116932 type:complete len:378 (-) Transcript_59598:56-1189(-)|eukprot:CAMPEP_0171943638 /NCGR_PEP_ID=MMETSP0993-20121228/39662_1 /TAXON_ID=483369 /ORGANISM="non described non described, Strain CCMP2098" /LENGTH=377 /DNA_ID=CAMNT_0012586281 /DNA_START=47 /DNA_END=1180 /DNA_ORIENTATION=-
MRRASLLLLLAGTPVVQAFCPVVICPGFGNDSLDYDTPFDQPAEVGLKSVLARRGFDPSQIYTVPVQRRDWFRVAGGLLDFPDFYLGTAKPTGRGYGWYVKRVKATVDLAYEQQPLRRGQDGGGGTDNANKKVLVIGHSAGGWLARAAMADGAWSEGDGAAGGNVVRTSDRVGCLVTMGAIHRVPEDASTCVTRGALRYTDQTYPGAFLKDEGVGYVSVGGAAITGDARKGGSAVGDSAEDDDAADTAQQQPLFSGLTAGSDEADAYYEARGEGSSTRVAFTSYKAVAGRGDLVGDGVVPFEWTQLEGSKCLQLDGVLHSINEAGTTLPTDRWYGSEKIVDQWLPAVLEEAKLKPKPQSGGNTLGELQKWASNFVIK